MTRRALIIRLVVYTVLLVLALRFRERMQSLPRAAPEAAAPLEITIEPASPPPGDPFP